MYESDIKKYERKGDIAHKNLSATQKGTDREHLLDFRVSALGISTLRIIEMFTHGHCFDHT
jgi:hypothetical protein